MASADNDVIQVYRDLADEVDRIHFSAPVSHVYNPLKYARPAHESYLSRFAGGRKRVVFLGMNPGPWGMAQTGIPFGDVETVSTWMRIATPIERPPREHPKRPVLGLQCPRVEVSGRRLWSWVRDRFGTPERFFSRNLVLNYCPLVFMEASARNRTPDRLPAVEREALFAVCDDALRRTIAILRPQWVIGVGRFARLRAEHALQEAELTVGEVLHPSPASPAANRGWREQAEAQLQALGVEL